MNFSRASPAYAIPRHPVSQSTSPLSLTMSKLLRFLILVLLAACTSLPTRAQEKPVWKSVGFAIVKLNDGPPISWNMYHAEKRGLLLLRIWKRYLLIDLNQQEVYDINPKTVDVQKESVAFSSSDKPSEPLDVTEWKERDVGSLDRLRFRLPKGAVVELQIPLRPDGKSLY
jgi:hypothetical protein